MAIRYVETKPAKAGATKRKAKAEPAAPIARARKPGRPLAAEAHLSAEATKPWEAAGMSRRTWYRRKRESDHG